MNLARISHFGVIAILVAVMQVTAPGSSVAADLYLPKLPNAFARDTESAEFKAFRTAWTALNSQKLDTANDLFKSAAEKFPDSVCISFGRILAEYYLGELTEAMPLVERALDKHPKSKELLMLKAMIFCNDQHPELASVVYDSLLSQEPNNPELLRLRAAAYVEQFRLDAAKTDIEKCLLEAPKWKNPLHIRGRIAFAEGQFNAAINNYSEALRDKSDPNAAEIYEDRSEAHRRLFDFEKAREDLNLADDKTYYTLRTYREILADAEYEHANKESNNARRFLICVGFPLALQNNLGFLTLTGKPTNDEVKKEAHDSMQKLWGFTDRAETLEMIWYLSSGAGNNEWLELWKEKSTLRGTSEQKRRQLLDNHHHTTYGKIDLVMKYGDEFGERGVIGYDLGRSTNLCREALRAGILTEHDALMIMLHNAKEMQSRYTSWEQYHREYLIGRSFWNPEIQAQDQASMELAASSYLRNPQSPLSQIPWNTKISHETVFPEQK